MLLGAGSVSNRTGGSGAGSVSNRTGGSAPARERPSSIREGAIRGGGARGPQSQSPPPPPATARGASAGKGVGGKAQARKQPTSSSTPKKDLNLIVRPGSAYAGGAGSTNKAGNKRSGSKEKDFIARNKQRVTDKA